jgi:thiol:disulfide interchange protein DsbD
VLPEGEAKKDDFHGDFQSYSGLLTVHVPVLGKADGHLDLNFTYQGCSSQGFCYPPVKQSIQVNLANITGPTDLTDDIVMQDSRVTFPSLSKQDYATQLFAGHHFLLILLGFLGLGLLLAFTPCVLPMVPILSGIIVGYGKDISTKKAFLLSLAYVLGMAIAYAITGVVVALLGSNMQIALQKPVVIGLFSVFFVLLALSLFGWYDIRLPNKLQQRIARWSHRHVGGTYVGVFFMGVFSTLVISPCVSAPLVGVLTYIAESGNVVLGGSALLAMGIGMGIPLLMVGTTAGRLLPKSGAWMEQVKHVFGLFMLGMAISMLGRIIPAIVALYLWAALVIFSAVYVWRLQRSEKIWRHAHSGFGIALLVYGFVLISSAIYGYSDPLNPFGKISPVLAAEKSPFVIVKNMDELDQQLALAKQNKKQVLLDFYADWCASCLVMDHHVFNQSETQHSLSKFILLRADVTQNNTFDRALMQRYHVVAPPTVVFFDAEGGQLTQNQIVGEVNEKEFIADLGQLSNHQRLNYCQSSTRDC